jgi:hypothetical protein
LVGSGLVAQAGDCTIDEVAVKLLRRCSAREFSWFKTADEDRETSQNRKAVATEGLGQGKSREHREEWWQAQATAAARVVNTAFSSNFAVSCIEDVWGKKKRERGK